MRKMVMIVFMLCFMVTGCAFSSEAKEEYGVTFSLSLLKELFEKHGIPLTPKTDVNPDAVFSRAYNDIKPEQFNMDKSQDISIYIYASTKEAKKGLEDFADSWAAADLAPYSSYHVANVLLFYGTKKALAEDKIIEVVAELKSLAKE